MRKISQRKSQGMTAGAAALGKGPKPVSGTTYLFGKFFGGLLAAAPMMLAYLVGMLLIAIWAAKIAPFSAQANATGLAVFLLPNLFIAGGILLAFTSLTRSRLAMWLGIVLLIGWLLSQLSLLRGLHARSVREGSMYGDLREAGQASATRIAFAACAPLSTSDRRPIPYMRTVCSRMAWSPGSVSSHTRSAPRSTRMSARILPLWLSRAA